MEKLSRSWKPPELWWGWDSRSLSEMIPIIKVYVEGTRFCRRKTISVHLRVETIPAPLLVGIPNFRKFPGDFCPVAIPTWSGRMGSLVTKQIPRTKPCKRWPSLILNHILTNFQTSAWFFSASWTLHPDSCPDDTWWTAFYRPWRCGWLQECLGNQMSSTWTDAARRGLLDVCFIRIILSFWAGTSPSEGFEHQKCSRCSS